MEFELVFVLRDFILIECSNDIDKVGHHKRKKADTQQHNTHCKHLLSIRDGVQIAIPNCGQSGHSEVANTYKFV